MIDSFVGVAPTTRLLSCDTSLAIVTQPHLSHEFEVFLRFAFFLRKPFHALKHSSEI